MAKPTKTTGSKTTAKTAGTRSAGAKNSGKKTARRDSKAAASPLPLRQRLRRLARRGALAALGLVALVLIAPGLINPPTTPTMMSERMRLGDIDQKWVRLRDVAPAMPRAAVAAEDANFCRHWGFDMGAIRGALEAGGRYGASTISQQTVKNVYLWQGRSWPRKALEALLTPMIELTWSKRRILEVYLNVAEFGEGVFGIDAAAWHYYGIPPSKLSRSQAARLAVLLPNPKDRDPNHLSPTLLRRADQIEEGAATILADGRSDCFDH
ncbi:monofunctional biosynthetic peptidoglycan transglycosylase [Rhodovulum sp. MB263]|uniref:monofunctional biosynthetic peptidoglycan transglycosylase n=1 Tax=Rhodovulum sp. (strain MB263) TaxID=308754 RepID=UPI0009B78F41|nr:monofunctional biosynthetic peptidoglycan transglycosylase [Rhodovulum sp. MB263]ARC90397.1 monofunctional biosynthetic peptidoglycan transglycosylase [Rhodovulum sp. MB263]